MFGVLKKTEKTPSAVLKLLQSIVPSVMALSLKASFYARVTTLATPLTWFKPTEGKNIGINQSLKNIYYHCTLNDNLKQ